ncbi:holin [Laceyella sacchari]|uniref:Toxin secretion/phage lysis holin n=2 Tax=Laceyella TaxID=292635 RepID=A0AA45WI88_9BACL|nr:MULTISPECIES: phage holin family protein [Laceyella]AUS10336.1 holin [Laceyella sacchari]PRZ12358.1 toxin secretion/phage lysis holin [Laceyella sediminis]SMP00272.1 toxin secretion/phage lysis holin [Laceyella tengchongensis]
MLTTDEWGEFLLKFTVGVLGGIVAQLFGGWSDALKALLIFVAIDYVTGFLAARKEEKLSSHAGFFGIARKVMIFAIVVVAHVIDTLLGDGHLLRDGAVFFYLANEALSIVENSGRMGLPIPSELKKGIEILRGGKEKKK